MELEKALATAYYLRITIQSEMLVTSSEEHLRVQRGFTMLWFTAVMFVIRHAVETESSKLHCTVVNKVDNIQNTFTENL